MHFLIYSNVDVDVINVEVCRFRENQKPKYFDSETQFFPIVKKSLIAP